LPALGVGVAVDDDVPDEIEHLRGPVARGVKAKSAGVVSISVVVARPFRKSAWAMTFSRKGMFVLTPRMRNSRRAVHARSQARSKVWPLEMTLTRSES
jgi:hypothetical protein